MNDTIDLETVRMKLARIWFIGSGIPFFLMVIQSILGKYEPKTQDAWSWFIPLVFPTLTLMISVMGTEAIGKKNKKKVRAGFAKLTSWLSVSYLIVLSLVIFLEPLSKAEPFKVFSMSNFFLGPIQALVVGALGYLFTMEPGNVLRTEGNDTTHVHD
jgi:hypothetical protein